MFPFLCSFFLLLLLKDHRAHSHPPSVQLRNVVLMLLFPRALESEISHLEFQLHCHLINSWCPITWSSSIIGDTVTCRVMLSHGWDERTHVTWQTVAIQRTCLKCTREPHCLVQSPASPPAPVWPSAAHLAFLWLRCLTCKMCVSVDPTSR